MLVGAMNDMERLVPITLVLKEFAGFSTFYYLIENIPQPSQIVITQPELPHCFFEFFLRDAHRVSSTPHHGDREGFVFNEERVLDKVGLFGV